MKAWERGRWEGYCTGPKPSGQRRSSEMPSREGREWLVDLDRHLRVFRVLWDLFPAFDTFAFYGGFLITF
jgi:hypothetical protein